MLNFDGALNWKNIGDKNFSMIYFFMVKNDFASNDIAWTNFLNKQTTFFGLRDCLIIQ
jgi:hypothetical protein